MKRLLLALFVSFLLCPGLSAQNQEQPKFTRTEDVIYGRKFGLALTLDVFEPARKNGAAIIYVVSSGFTSRHDAIKPGRFMAFLERNYTVFVVVHGSQPRFIVPEIPEDIHRAVRFVRHNASRWGVDPKKFGISGASAGGHLSLTMGTQGKPGKPDASDPIERESSAVQAVACFFPPTDFLNWSKPGEGAWDFAAMRPYAPAFGPKWTSPEGRQELGREISPVYYVTSSMAPTLILHGDADKLVPVHQAQVFDRKCKDVGAVFKLIIVPGAGHGWPGWEKDVAVCADWFDEHLLRSKN